MKFKAYTRQLGIPGAISALGLLSAWLATLLLLQGQLKYSVILAVAAFGFDTLDGFVARKLNRTSELGRQLDSMVDVISYSLYAALVTAFELLPGWLGVITGFSVLTFGILRLIKFNTEGYINEGGVQYYRGVVVCHLSLATIILLLLSTKVALPAWFTATTLLSLSVLQLSNIKTRKSGMLPFWYTIAAALVIGAIIWLP